MHSPPNNPALLPLAAKLGEYFGCKPIEQPKPVDPPQRPTRKDIWPPAVQAEIEAIYATPDPFENDARRDRADEEQIR